MDREIRIVVVDHHTLVREGLRHILDSEPDIKVVGLASNGLEAVDLTARLGPDVIVLDASLRGIEELIQHLIRCLPRVKVLTLLANGDVHRALSLLRAGAIGCLHKRATSQDLIAAVRHASQGVMVLGPTVAREVIDELVHCPLREVDAEDEPWQALTKRETEVLQLLCQGYSDKKIAQELHISARTVGVHLYHIYSKLGVHSRAAAMRLALRKGWVSLFMALPVLQKHCLAP